MNDPETGAAARTPADSQAVSRRTRRRYVWLASLVGLVIALWSTYWAIGRGMAEDLLHNAVAVARAEGGEIGCGAERFGGYPFKFELACAPLTLADATGLTATAAGLRAVALAYNPGHLILEADAPLDLAGLAAPLPGKPGLQVTWTLAQASGRLGGDGLARADVALSAPRVLLVAAPDDPAPVTALEAGQASLHLRASPDAPGDADLAASAAELVLPGAPRPLAASLTLRLAGGAALLQGAPTDLRALLSAEGALRVTSLAVRGPDFALSGEGSLNLDDKGRLAGDLPLTVTGAEHLPQALAPLFPAGSNAATALAGAILAFGRPATLDGAPAVTVPLAFRDGVVRVGLVPIAPLAPLM